MMRVFERVEPTGRCVTPDGHEHLDFFSLNSPIPNAIVCPNCGKLWGVVVWDEDEQ